jgi:hypothetical protein
VKIRIIWKIALSLACIAVIATVAIGWQAHQNKVAAEKLAQAAQLAHTAAEQGIADAEVTLGSLYYHGLGVPQDYPEALRWFQKSADQGDPSGQYHVGVMYLYGSAVTQDYPRAISLFRAAASQGYPTADDQLGTMYAHAIGLPLDYAEAFSFYSRAAELGYARGQEHLGAAYFYGRGVTQDYPRAAIWFRKAADQGDPSAEFDLGTLYRSGQGVPPSFAKARQWLRKAADQGDERALSAITFGLAAPEKIVLRMTVALGIAFALNFVRMRTLRQKVTAATGALILFSAGYDWYGYTHARILTPLYGVDAFTAFYWLLPAGALAAIVYIARLGNEAQPGNTPSQSGQQPLATESLLS